LLIWAYRESSGGFGDYPGDKGGASQRGASG